MSDIVWETFDGLFKTLHRQGRRVEQLEARVAELERRLQESSPSPAAEDASPQVPAAIVGGTPDSTPARAS
jgi:BMFP domain-containing protein YqiC